MGLGIHTRATLPRRGLFKRPMSQESVFDAIQSAIRAKETDELAARMLGFERRDRSLGVQFDWNAEMLEFAWDPKGFVTASAKTSTAGPGYHAYVVDMVKHVGTALGVTWEWENESEGLSDETGFATSDNFAELQQEMRHFAAKLCRTVLEQTGGDDGLTNIAINWPLMGVHVIDASFIVTPAGPFSKEWAEQTAADPSVDAAQEFYTWWERGRGAQYWRKTGIGMLWSDVHWRAPGDEHERQRCQLALDCLARARSLDAGLALPTREIKELESLVKRSAEDPASPPSPDGIGFFRKPVRHTGAGAWSLLLPGYYYLAMQDDGATMQWFFGDRCVYQSSMTISHKDKQPGSAKDLLKPFLAEEREKPTLMHEAGQLAGFATLAPPSAESNGLWTLSGAMAAPGEVAMLTITFQNESDRAWAEEVFRSLTHPGPPQ